MTTVYLAPTYGDGYQGFTTGGLPLNAGLLYTYIAGGTTPQATYTTSAGSVQNANPVVLGTDGRPPSQIWLAAGAAYRFDLKDSLGNLIKTDDNLYGINDPASANGILAGGTFTGAITMSGAPINEAQGANIASASTINLTTATGNYVQVTGVVTITAVTLAQGYQRMVEFAGALVLTNGASLILPGGANITTAAGDIAVFRGEAGGVVRCTGYLSGATALQAATKTQQQAGTSGQVVVTPLHQQDHPSAAKAAGKWDSAPTLVNVFNVSSITKNGTGDWTVNFTTSFAAINYTGVATVPYDVTRSDIVVTSQTGTIPTVGAMRFGTTQLAAGTRYDPSYICFAAFGGQ